ncbi:hypothetical protein BJY04DRAFT_213924 [Aspergillus karnatakaensis]|uniref:uncharacterized protein n=1 Tax=Aspergillus karnatakaensis TaxID=1810916 RepID=UPI003CCCB629
MEESYMLGPKPKPLRARMKKACDYCRRSKIKCEKIEGSASCTACERRSYACIITSAPAPVGVYQPPLVSTAPYSSVSPDPQFATAGAAAVAVTGVGQDVSNFIAFRQRTKILLHDWIYGDSMIDLLLPVSYLFCHQPSRGERIRTRDIQGIPNLLKDVGDSYQKNLTLAFSRLAVVEGQTDTQQLSAEENEPSHTPYPLPSPSEIYQILHTFSLSTSSILPFFKDEIESWLANGTYLDPRLPEDVTTWAALNVVLAMGYTLHLVNHPDQGNQQDFLRYMYRQYLQNALATVPRLILHAPSLTSVQALFGMATLLNSNFELPSTHGLLAIAVQQAHTLGVHRTDLADHEQNSESRTRVFWLGYILDKMYAPFPNMLPIPCIKTPNHINSRICTAQGLGPYEDEANSLITLPESTPSSDHQGDTTSIPLFTLFARISIIKGRIFKAIYANAEREKHTISRPPQPDKNPTPSTESLESELTTWRQSLPPGTESSIPATEPSSSRLATVVLLLMYYQAIITLYRPIYFSLGAAARRGRPIDIRVLACVNSARRTAGLMRFYPVHVPLCGRSLLSYVYTSLVILTMHILDDPEAERASGDLHLVRELSALMSGLIDASHGVTQGSVQALGVLLEASRYHLESAERAVRGGLGD